MNGQSLQFQFFFRFSTRTGNGPNQFSSFVLEGFDSIHHRKYMDGEQ
jgi:hypothetical protein